MSLNKIKNKNDLMKPKNFKKKDVTVPNNEMRRILTESDTYSLVNSVASIILLLYNPAFSQPTPAREHSSLIAEQREAIS